MKLLDKFQRILMRFIFIRRLPVRGGQPPPEKGGATRRQSCDRASDTPKVSCSSYYYSSNSHYNEAIADCIEFFKRSSQDDFRAGFYRSSLSGEAASFGQYIPFLIEFLVILKKKSIFSFLLAAAGKTDRRQQQQQQNFPFNRTAMEDDESLRVVPFQLQFDKPIAYQIKIAEWNPEKDLLAMVTEDSKLLLHRFNWQRLWITSPGKCITAICWRPDGKAIAVGLDDGTISVLDVENGKLLRSMKFHGSSVVCLNWVENREKIVGANRNNSSYEDRTSRFFPSAPRVPRTPGIIPGDNSGLMEITDDSFQELLDPSHQQLDILCSGDKEGSICFNIFAFHDDPLCHSEFQNIHNLALRSSLEEKHVLCQLTDASICKVTLSSDLRHIIVLCSGVVTENGSEKSDNQISGGDISVLHSLVLDSTVFRSRKNELHQVAQQASNVEHMMEVIQRSLDIMSKQWSDAMHLYHDKFNVLSTLITDHGLDSGPQEEFLSLLGGARTSPPVHQFLVNSLGEAGIKRTAKIVCGAGKELQTIVLNNLQPAAEIIAFRMGELRGLSKWRARFRGIGLDENLIDHATEKSGMLLVQIERFIRILSSVVQQFSNFFNWLLKCVKVLMSEPSDQLLPFSSELVIIFLKFLYDQDPIGALLRDSESDQSIGVDLETDQRIKELTLFGGFADCEYLKRTLAVEFQQLQSCFKEALEMPLATVSKKILCKDMLPLFPSPSPNLKSSYFPVSVSFYQETSHSTLNQEIPNQGLIDYTCFMVPNETFPNISNCIGIARGLISNLDNFKSGHSSLEIAVLHVPDDYNCVDLSLYKEEQIVLLLNQETMDSESSGNACMMIIQDSVMHLQMENEKVREISHSVVAPLAVSASRGVACIFAAKKRALVYILDEDEDEGTDSE
ncbi:anaphase-promoting complex subunit 4 [Striga asiatica]|uniref:Anaphase-promoting complex subunit 4 n=1 Tax=Striga asiatica TaxID=4170 RepID=A0A5A7RIM7_STRAF|nr:anaphase-promoting complex subunit 4 [Striga asiatica]